MVVDLESFEKTELEKVLDKIFGGKDRNIYDDIEDTYKKYMWKHSTTNIKIKVKELEPQIYKVGVEEIEIVN